MLDAALQNIPNPLHFVGVAGSGMSALAQFMAWKGHKVTGSDRQFHLGSTPVKGQLEACGIQCLSENASALDEALPKAIVVSTAIEADHPQLLWAQSKGISVLHRSELLERLCDSFKTIAVAGTSGKSTTTAMIFHILRRLGAEPSVLTGAGLCDLQAQGLIGNAYAGKGEWLVIEADESDGTLERYRPAIGLLLNIDRDHKELDELQALFSLFRAHTKGPFVAWRGQARTRALSSNQVLDFGQDPNCGFCATDIEEGSWEQSFVVRGCVVRLPIPGAHNRDNALAALAAVHAAGFDHASACAALGDYPGIFRRFQVLGRRGSCAVVDDFAHNPAKIAAAIRAAQSLAPSVRAWFQPHGFAPTRFIRDELGQVLAEVLRDTDELVLSDIYYAGGTVHADICSKDLVDQYQALGLNVRLVEKRADLASSWAGVPKSDVVFLLLGARDPSLADFAKNVASALLVDEK